MKYIIETLSKCLAIKLTSYMVTLCNSMILEP